MKEHSVRINFELSYSVEIISGVPQVCVIGSSMILAYINDLAIGIVTVGIVTAPFIFLVLFLAMFSLISNPKFYLSFHCNDAIINLI